MPVSTQSARENTEIRMSRRTALELTSKKEMSPRKIAIHYARLQNVYEIYDISSRKKGINIDESKIYSCTAGIGKKKGAMRVYGR